MYTYQDLLGIGDNDKERMTFIRNAISQHKRSEMYETAWVADLYNKHRNVTINEYQKLLYTVTGSTIPDNWNANFKMACNHFHRFVTHENQFLLGNGTMWEDDSTKDKLGTKKYPFDSQLQEMGKNALVHGVSFGFWNLDHVEVFSLLEFVPLYDEDNGSLSAGIRFWQIADNKPLVATLYELDGYTEYRWANGKEGEITSEKREYKLNVGQSEADGIIIYGGENYPTFPIVPMWGNPEHQSEIVGLREQIDCYDLIKSGFANTVDEASIVYWTIQNAGGMDDVDLAKFVDRMRTLHATIIDENGAQAESHQMDAPYASREALLGRLNEDLYRDAMALDSYSIAGGAATATQIRAAYEPLNSKTDDFEYCVLDFIQGILSLAGIEDSASFTRSMIVNASEDLQTVIQAAQFLEPTYVVRKILTILGDADQADQMITEMEAEALGRLTEGYEEADTGEDTQNA